MFSAENLPAYGTSGMPRAYIEVELLKRLKKASQITSTLAKNILTQPDFRVTPNQKEMLRTAYLSWFKYWAWQSAYLNEVRRIDITPLPSTPKDELTKDGFRQESESMASNLIGEVARLYFLAHLDQDQGLSEWSLNDTREDFWVQDGWNTLEVNPSQSLDDPPEALERMRKENEDAKRREEREGPKLKEKVIPETPEEKFNKVFQTLDRSLGQKKPRPQQPEYQRHLLWFRPVSAYTQRNLYDVVMMLVEYINDYPSGHTEVMRLIHELLCRLGSFFLSPGSSEMIDIPRYRMQIINGQDMYWFNRSFKVWCACYFYELVQRVHYVSHIGVNPLIVENVDAHVPKLRDKIVSMCAEMGQIDFFKLYRLSTEECYEFPGDALFCKYLHPEGSVTRGDLLSELHGDRQAVRFFSEAKVQTQTIMHNILQSKTHLARVCVLNALDRYFFMDGIKWRAGAVVDQTGIQMSHTKLTESTIPCLVAPMSDYYAHYEYKAYRGETIFHSVVAWLLLIKHYKQGFFYRSDISKHIAYLLEEDQVIAERPVQDDYEELGSILGSFVVKKL